MFTQNVKRFEFNSVSQKTSSSTKGVTPAALGPSNAVQQTTLPLVAVVCRNAVTVTRSLKREIISAAIVSVCLPQISQEHLFFPANFNLLLPIRQPNGLEQQHKLCCAKRGVSPAPNKTKLNHHASHITPIPETAKFWGFFVSERVKEFEYVLQRCHRRRLSLCLSLIRAQ